MRPIFQSYSFSQQSCGLQFVAVLVWVKIILILTSWYWYIFAMRLLLNNLINKINVSCCFVLWRLECFTPKSAHPLHVLVSLGTHAWLPRICPLVCNQPPVSLPLHPNIYDNRRKKNRLRNSNRILFWSFGQAFGHPPFPLLGSKDALPFIGLLVRFALERQRLYQCTQTILMLKLCLFGQS